jgi:hypothetical protein
MSLSSDEKNAILAFVDSVVPPGAQSVWLTGSRATGLAHAKSDWDVVAVHPDARSILKEGPIINQVGYILGGQKIELVIIAPGDWDHSGCYMTDCRAHGVRLR